jgi:hypothetical protein
MAPVIVLAGVGFLAVIVSVIFTVLVVGIRKGDRRHLNDAPQSASDAFTRPLFVGIRYPSDNPDGDHR